jgi:3-phenylpropionate/trans-cinnamate dioxygenase ferredoxin reductase subunit
MSDRIIVVGAGQAGGQAVDTLIRREFPGTLTLVGEERHPPYQRPPLSKKLLAGEMEVERTYLKGGGYFSEHGVVLHLSRRATAIHRENQELELDDGERIGYDRLLLATGSRARPLPVPGADLPGVYLLRTIDDVEAIRARFKEGAKLVVVGGGFIGLEVAAVGITCGLQVTVLEAAPRLLGRVMPVSMSDWFENLHTRRGADVRCDVTVTGFQGDDQVEGVITTSGTVPADLVVVGIGIIPNQELAAESGIHCDDGIVVDEHCATSDPNVYAAGDCTRHPQNLLGGTLRLESVHNAMSQGRVAASCMVGDDATYREIPWFWSDQYDVKLQMVGLSTDHDEALVRGDMDSGKFCVFYLRDGVLIAADVISNPRDFMICRKLVPRLERFDPEHLADPERPLQELV